MTSILPHRDTTPLLHVANVFGIRNLLVKDESVNPTYTFKDRLSREMLMPIWDAIQSGRPFERTTYISISNGNTARSLGHFCSLLNAELDAPVVNALALIPKGIKSKAFGPDTAGRYVKASEMLDVVKQDCHIIEIDLDSKVYRSNEIVEMARRSGLSFENIIDVTEGLDRPAYERIFVEVLEEQLGIEPDYTIVPFGAGILCNEIIDYVKAKGLRTKVIPVSSGNPNTIAVMLYGPIWVDVASLEMNGYGLTRHDRVDRKGRLREPYVVYHIEDEEIIEAMKVLGPMGISCEPSGASGFAILHRLGKIDPEFDPGKHSVLVINTGNSFPNYRTN